MDYNCFFKSHSRTDNSYSFHIKPYTVIPDRPQMDSYPYGTVEYKVLFVYGTDFKRGTNLSNIPEWIQIVATF